MLKKKNVRQKRIKEAESNVRQYLEEDLLKKRRNDIARKTYIENAELSLETAQKLLSLENEKYRPYLWIIVSSYYSMYYIANAVLLNLSYKVGAKISHKVTSDALIVFVRNKLKRGMIEEYEDIKQDALDLISSKADSILTSFDLEREKRSKFQYKMDENVKRGKALTSLKRASEFMFEMKKLL